MSCSIVDLKVRMPVSQREKLRRIAQSRGLPMNAVLLIEVERMKDPSPPREVEDGQAD